MKKKHLDIFSGIGGFALAADCVWGKENIEHIFCDNDEFCQQVLKKHWPNSKIYGDIKTLTNADFGRQQRTELLQQRRFSNRRSDKIYLLTGGFPCQPFSHAGRRKGTEDDRYLWPEMLRVIREFRPQWVVGENVAGLVTWSEGLVLEQVCADLEAEGYEVQPFIIPAVAVNAPHRRDRVWIVAHSKSGKSGKSAESKGGKDTSGADSNVAYTRGIPARNEKRRGVSETRKGIARYSEGSTDWSQNWFEIATRLCRVDDGIPRRLDRNSRLKALGNAIVPQVAEEIFKAIKLTNN